jgi:hypothetical protein
MKVLLNYANEPFRESQRKNSATGLAVGGFDRVISVGPQDIDADFRSRHRSVLNQPRGNGYWLWKPYFIARTLRELAVGDFLFYCDAGAHFVAPIDPLVEVCLRDGQDLISFENQLVEKHWTTRDAFVALDCDRPEFTDSSQRLASFMLWRKSAWSLQFAAEWLAAAENPRLLTGRQGELGLPNYDGFTDHRHDQSLYSLLTKRHGLVAYRSPSQLALQSRARYPNSPYGQILEHTREIRLPLRLKLLRELKAGYKRLQSLLRAA